MNKQLFAIVVLLSVNPTHASEKRFSSTDAEFDTEDEAVGASTRARFDNRITSTNSTPTNDPAASQSHDSNVQPTQEGVSNMQSLVDAAKRHPKTTVAIGVGISALIYAQYWRK